MARNSENVSPSWLTAPVRDGARGFLAFAKDLFGARTVLDVYVWRSGASLVLGLSVNPTLFNRSLPNGVFRGAHTDYQAQRALGLPVSLRRVPGGYYLDGGAGQTMSQPEAFVGEVFDGLDTIVTEWVVNHLGGSATQGRVAVLPAPATPATNVGQPYYSTKAGRLYPQTPPEGLVRLADGTRGLDPCRAGAGRLERPSWGTGKVSWRSGQTAMYVTHCVNLDRPVAAGIKRCAGLLYPSLAIASRPAVVFGRLALFADIGVVETALAGAPDAHRLVADRDSTLVYPTDVWTETTTGFMGEHSQRLYAQAVGLWAPSIWTSENSFAVLGPRAGEDHHADHLDEDGHVLRTWSAMNRVLQRKHRAYAAVRTGEEADEVAMRYRLSGHAALSYPYMEAKVHRILPLEAFMFAVAPEDNKARARQWLRSAGYPGKTIFVEDASQDPWVYGAQCSAAVAAAGPLT